MQGLDDVNLENLAADLYNAYRDSVTHFQLDSLRSPFLWHQQPPKRQALWIHFAQKALTLCELRWSFAAPLPSPPASNKSVDSSTWPPNTPAVSVSTPNCPLGNDHGTSASSSVPPAVAKAALRVPSGLKRLVTQSTTCVLGLED